MTQMTCPKMKACIIIGTRVKGMQKTASSRSDTARFSRYMLVTVRIFLWRTRVRMTRLLPPTASRKITPYGMDRNTDSGWEAVT